jgi:hypothetical protein
VVNTEEIFCLGRQTSFDGCLSNFGGLNCVSDLPSAAINLARLLRPGAKALFCVLGPRCAWEVIWFLAKGEPRKAFRRFTRGGVNLRLNGGASFRVQYYTVREMVKVFSPGFRLIRWQGVGVAVPPSYEEPLALKFPGVMNTLAAADRWFNRIPLMRSLGDHILFEFERTGV